MEPDDRQRAILLFRAAVDRATATVAGLLIDVGIEPIVMKGPTFAQWLYRDGARVYGDADILVDPVEWGRAFEVLRALGFVDSLTELAHPRMESEKSWALSRGHEQVDLHCSIAGLEAPAANVWRVLRSHAEPFQVDGTPLLAFDEVARTMQVALHAAHHPNGGKPEEDLRRAITRVDHRTWTAARDLALELDGGPAFAAGLRTLPEGAGLARVLGVYDLRSVPDELRSAAVPLAEGLNGLLTASGTSVRLHILRAEMLPNAAFMRWNHPLARRGRRGLIASYPLRWASLMARLPRGVIALARTRRLVGRQPAP